jgi:hypothetical protein
MQDEVTIERSSTANFILANDYWQADLTPVDSFRMNA